MYIQRPCSRNPTLLSTLGILFIIFGNITKTVYPSQAGILGYVHPMVPSLVKVQSVAMYIGNGLLRGKMSKGLNNREVGRVSAAIMMVLLISGDVNPNPGPQSQAPDFPCGCCGANVSWSEQALCCDHCDIWFHKSCVGISSGVYEELGNTSDMWFCTRCKSDNESSCTFHNYSLNISVSSLIGMTQWHLFRETAQCSQYHIPLILVGIAAQINHQVRARIVNRPLTALNHQQRLL